MGWVKEPHRCNPPTVVHESVGKLGQYFECDHCKAQWRVQARVLIEPKYRQFGLTYTRRVCDTVYTISWQEKS